MASSISSHSAPTRANTRNSKRARSESKGDDADPETKRVSKVARLDTPENLSSVESVGIDLKPFAVRELPGAEVFYIPNFVDEALANSWYEELVKLDTWYHPTLKLYGKPVTQSRSISAYASTTAVTAKYSGHQVIMHYADDTPELLRTIWEQTSARLNLVFNHVMMNQYANGGEYIGRHRDTKENGVIASLSLGAVRTFIMTPNNPAIPSKRWALANGSLLIMKGSTQDNWKHEIPKEPKVENGRISLTFRQMPDNEATATKSRASRGSIHTRQI